MLSLLILLVVNAQLSVCTQNLQRAEPQDTRKLSLLAERIKEASCDVVALQEVYGKSEDQARKVLDHFDNFSHTVSGTNDQKIRNAFLFRGSKLDLLRTTSYERYPLPQINPREGNSRYTRGPLVALFRLKDTKKHLLLVNFHFKSKYGGWKDPYKLDYELLRMEMAAGIHDIVRKEKRRIPADTAVILLGDRNADRGDATTRVLTGELELPDFLGNCRVNRRYKALCNKASENFQKYQSLVDYALAEKEPYKRSWGSYRRKGESFLLDDIMVPPALVGNLEDAGFKGLFGRGSDHLLVWAKLNF